MQYDIGDRVTFERCNRDEDFPPAGMEHDSGELDNWIAQGNSLMPRQTHLNEPGTIIDFTPTNDLVVEFDNGQDQRVLEPDEVEPYTDRPTLAERIIATGITMTAKQIENKASDHEGQTAWRCTLRLPDSDRIMRLTFRMGAAYDGRAPTINEVLECLLSDASTIENTTTFEDFCSELGYNTDSRKDSKIYTAAKNQTAKLRTLLGEAYTDWLWNTEQD